MQKRRKAHLFYGMIDIILKSVLHFTSPAILSETIALKWGYRYRPAPAIATLRSGAKIAITENDHLQLLLYYLGIFEPQCIKLMRKYLRPGAVALDVGANVGLYTIEAAQAVGPRGRVISIEASSSNFEAAKNNVELNGLQNVDLLSCAVGDANGIATLTLPSQGNHGMFTLGAISGMMSRQVQVRRIDDVLDELNISRIDFIKMDIEGSELRALNGAVNLLNRCRPPILIELNESALSACGATSREVKDLLFSLGYKGWIVERERLSTITLGTQHICDECFFLATV